MTYLHISPLFIESEKLSKKVLIEDSDKTVRDWVKLEEVGSKGGTCPTGKREVALIHVANIFGRPFIEIMAVLINSYPLQQNLNAF